MHEKDQYGWTPLYLACSSGHAVIAMALIEKGANVNDKNRLGRTPLYYACIWGHSATAMTLLENGAVGVNDRDHFGNAPSYWACRSCTADVVLRMIRKGAILTASNLQGFRDQHTVTEDEARKVEDAYKREENWRRRAPYVMFLSSIRDLGDEEYGPGPYLSLDDGGDGMGRGARVLRQARLMRVVDMVLCRTNTQRLIGSFL